jgi:hypothetical protein
MFTDNSQLLKTIFINSIHDGCMIHGFYPFLNFSICPFGEYTCLYVIPSQNWGTIFTELGIVSDNKN